MKKSKYNQYFPVFLLIIASVLISGCTSADGNTPATETPNVEPTEEQGYSGHAGNSSMKVFWPQTESEVSLPSYSDEEKQSLIEEAKKEILRLFPYVAEESIDRANISWKTQSYNSYRSPSIIFEDIFESYPGENRYVEVDYDPERKMVSAYLPHRGIVLPNSNESFVSDEEAKERALDFYKKALGDEYRYHENDFITTDKDDPWEGIIPDTLYVRISTRYKGVVYSLDQTWVDYDLKHDKVETYVNSQGSHDIMSQVTTLSPEPDITIDEARQILENYLKDKNGGENVSIEYCPRYEYEEFPNLLWDDALVKDIDVEDGYMRSPFKLVWELPFITPDNNRMHYMTIDAHTGEIILFESF
ncbi:hypothetical protein J2128_001982 [Methanomicrobium sp. W14]|uniref:PepSY domain-containing protein n=1 Tax=Methanomicrobium sp. W14 TaxID=2817839 RepID=UPI001AE6681C|nr:PepSY domain-containing protein [Methanomicrobium sp. W14]MBP2134016.1 hypothetical protein [Methanomicrobium sp. W14]